MMLRKEISDEKLRWISNIVGGCDLENGPWIAGGCARLLWFDKPWINHDVDLFFPSADRFNAAQTALNILRAKFNLGQDDMPGLIMAKSSDQPFESANAVTYTITPASSTSSVRIQLIRKSWHPDLRSVLASFDFTACNFATDGRTIIADPTAVADCSNMRLRMSATGSCKLTAIRTLKYSIYGFEPDSSIMAELIGQYRDGTISNNMDEDSYT